jgi:hypothetical protein
MHNAKYTKEINSNEEIFKLEIKSKKFHQREVTFLFWVQKICKYLLEFVYTCSIQDEISIKKKIYN